jgi:hypothetical protein
MRWLKRIALTLSAMTLLLVVGIGVVLYRATELHRQLANSRMSQEAQVGPTIGDLGGLPVSIPPRIARFVEYEGDPHFLEPRHGPRPVRTFESKLRSFGFEVRFPDMALVHDETPEQKREIHSFNTMWLSVGVSVEFGQAWSSALVIVQHVDLLRIIHPLSS